MTPAFLLITLNVPNCVIMCTCVCVYLSMYSLLLPSSGGCSHTLAGSHLRTSPLLLAQSGMLLEHMPVLVLHSGLCPNDITSERPSLKLQLPHPCLQFLTLLLYYISAVKIYQQLVFVRNLY